MTGNVAPPNRQQTMADRAAQLAESASTCPVSDAAGKADAAASIALSLAVLAGHAVAAPAAGPVPGAVAPPVPPTPPGHDGIGPIGSDGPTAAQALIAAADLIATFPGSIGTHTSVTTYSGRPGLSAPGVVVTMTGAVGDHTGRRALDDLRTVCDWLGIDPAGIDVQRNGLDSTLTIVETTTVHHGVPITLHAGSRSWTGADARAVLGVPDTAPPAAGDVAGASYPGVVR